MLRGTSRRMIYIKNTGSPYFEEAYFVVRRDCRACQSDEAAMIREASRIAGENIHSYENAVKKRKLGAKVCTALAFFSGAAVCALIFLLL